MTFAFDFPFDSGLVSLALNGRGRKAKEVMEDALPGLLEEDDGREEEISIRARL